ncbi:hypothetical protein [Telmatospirillum sp. J64-1]|nr:hypothetical protein [Telmatospirillum sp. J64-1]
MNWTSFFIGFASGIFFLHIVMAIAVYFLLMDDIKKPEFYNFYQEGD